MSARLLLNNNNCNPQVSGLYKSGSTSDVICPKKRSCFFQ
jgi:hypothetical protein